MLAFNKTIIDEIEVICQWVDYHGTLCNNPVKGKDVKAHLYHRHGITSDSQPYLCLWHKCFSQPMRRSSLERHMKEHHVSVRWACPYCDHTFTRNVTMMSHIERSHGQA
ncbi:hypothetical protein J3R83DRAFT_13583 [Lanmaoa asiatica]|nr:hypothetical protein J3R83DRAFT_13583 [Lanmaoa asiatica]